MTDVEITRRHTIAVGHRVAGHESKCRLLHGHNLQIDITLSVPALDSVGRVLDFGEVKTLLCGWLEDHWDHRMLLWEGDPLVASLEEADEMDSEDLPYPLSRSVLGIVLVPLNPTAENLAALALMRFNALLLEAGYSDAPGDPRNVRVVRVTVHETPKCSATVTAR